MDSAEENSEKDLASNSNSNRGVIMDIENSVMECEMTNAIDGAEEVNDASSSPTASTRIISSVPVERVEDSKAIGAIDDDMDIESFSFGSEAEENLVEADATRTPELSISFDIKILQTVVEASAHALDIVTGKDVVIIAGKTGEMLYYKAVEIFSVQSTYKFINLSTFYDRSGKINAAPRDYWKKDPRNRAHDFLLRRDGNIGSV